jgi:uncharacterized protein (DUF1501 family)
MQRRTFLKSSALVSAAMLMPDFLHAFTSASSSFSGRRLVVVQLNGGNDGLNTVVPFQDDLYYKARPTLALPKATVLRLDQQPVGLHPVLLGMRERYAEGELAVFTNVGYPNPDRSHFRSLDIWHSACDTDGRAESGWLGRYLDARPDGKPYDAIEIDSGLSLAMKGLNRSALAVSSPETFRRLAADPLLVRLAQGWKPSDAPAASELAFLYRSLVDTSSSAEYLYEQAQAKPTRQVYPHNRFGDQLRTIATLINAGLQTQVYYAALVGFDTHAGQLGIQQRLLKQLDEGLDALVCDLKANNQWKNTLVLVFTEFGRRVEQNASGGTDHGTANNVFVLGGNLKSAGVHGGPPDLTNLDLGDLRHSLDFRQLYATVLRDWLGADDKRILGRQFERVKLV